MSIVTIQAGNFANYCGANFWNLEEETFGHYSEDPPIESTICYQELSDGRWVPRVMCLDKTGSSGRAAHEDIIEFHSKKNDDDALHGIHAPQSKQINEDEEEEKENEFEGQNVEILKEEPIPRHHFQKDMLTQQPLDPKQAYRENIRYWSDFCKIDLSRSIRELRGIHQGLPFTYFQGGSDVNIEQRNDIEDDLRRQVERCDRVDATHVLVDSTDAFAHITQDLLIWTREELSKAGILVASLSESIEDCSEPNKNAAAANDELNRKVAQGLFMNSTIEAETNIILPIDTPKWKTIPFWTTPTSRIDASAMIGLALYNATFPYQAKDPIMSASNFMRTCFSSRICGLRLHAPIRATSTLTGGFDLTATTLNSDCQTFCTLQGANETMNIIKEARRATYDERKIILPLPFPQSFDSRIQEDGFFDENNVRLGDVEKLMIGTVMHDTPWSETVYDSIQAMERFRTKGRLQGVAVYGLEEDNFVDALEKLRAL